VMYEAIAFLAQKTISWWSGLYYMASVTVQVSQMANKASRHGTARWHIHQTASWWGMRVAYRTPHGGLPLCHCCCRCTPLCCPCSPLCCALLSLLHHRIHTSELLWRTVAIHSLAVQEADVQCHPFGPHTGILQGQQ